MSLYTIFTPYTTMVWLLDIDQKGRLEMARKRAGSKLEFSRRQFLITTGGALAGMAALGFAELATAAERHPQRRGTLHFGSSGDAAGLDAHTHNQNHVSVPTTMMYTGLTDIDQRGNIVPGIAESWEPNKELTAWTFRLRKGVLFHNGREVDAEAVKLNLMRIKDPTIGGDFERGAVDTIESVEVLDKYTVRIHATMPDVSCIPAVERHALSDPPDGARCFRCGLRPPDRHRPVQVRLLDSQ
jgi:peptide/nickel transport system substrate-binding protein